MKCLLFSVAIMVVFTGCSQPSAEEMFKKGEDAQRSEQYDTAIDAYQELINAYPDSVRTPEAWYAIASIRQNHKKQYHQAILDFRQVVEKYPNHATASSALFLIGFIYNNDLKNFDSARIAYEDFLKRFPANPLVESAQFELSTLGKDPTEILQAQTPVAKEEMKPAKKGKKK